MIPFHAPTTRYRPPARTRVLLVDDDEAFTRLIQVQLERTGKFEVGCLHSGTVVEREAAVWQPDIIILDFIMPEMDGGMVFQRLKHNPDLAFTPIILLTGLAEEDSPLQSGIGPGRLTLAKPVNPAKLEEAIDLLTGAAGGEELDLAV